MANVDLARIQFAFVTINHFFFVPVTIGLAFLTVLPRPVAPRCVPAEPNARPSGGCRAD